MSRPTLAAPDPTESCRTDFGTFSYRLEKNEQVSELFAWVDDLARYLLPAGKWEGPHRGRHFTHVFKHDSAISLEFTPPGDIGRNSGIAVVNLPGQIWGALDSKDRLELITDVKCVPGYFRCTRWDAQMTVLDPPITVQDFVDEVEARKIWAVRYGVGNPWTKKNLHGEHVEPPTQYFGSKDSMVLGRVYDHGVKWKWPMPSLRFELQFRKTWANDHFDRLEKRAVMAVRGHDDYTNCEEETVKQALRQHMDLRDTSQWSYKRKPKNWAQTAPKLDWYDELLDVTHDPLKATYKPATDVHRAREVMCGQYGPKTLLSLVAESWENNQDYDEVAMNLVGQMAQHLKAEHFEQLRSLVKPAAYEAACDFLRNAQKWGAVYGEHFDSVEGAKPPRG
jgi:hypothetical protein